MNQLKLTVDSWERLKKKEKEAGELLGLAEKEDSEILQGISADVKKIESELRDLETKSLFNGPYDRHNIVFSVHSGAGGVEACDWAGMLMRMYTRWMEKKGFKSEVVHILPGQEAGIKSATLIISGDCAYGYLKSEKGVHRLVRISPFDANKRRHTSFASVDVIPEVEGAEVQINEADLKIDAFRSSGPGGQHMQKTSSAVRVTHIPTGVIATCESGRSQLKNKESALKVLRARLFEIEQEKKEEEMKKIRGENKEIAWGSQIRSYVLEPYQLIKDLRTGIETSNVKGVLDGEIDIFIEGHLRTIKSG